MHWVGVLFVAVAPVSVQLAVSKATDPGPAGSASALSHSSAPFCAKPAAPSRAMAETLNAILILVSFMAARVRIHPLLLNRP